LTGGGCLSLASQIVHPGRLIEAYQRELAVLAASNAIQRLWAKDATLWPASEHQRELTATNLRWLDLPEQIGPYMARAAEVVVAAQREGFQDVVFIAMGDSNLAAETVASVSREKRTRRLFLLDSIHPAAVQAVDEQLDVRATLFVLASKTGKRIETHALLLYFLHRLKTQGASEPGRYFVAVTEEGSYLAMLARSYGFLKTFLDPPGLRGRFSALIHFGLLQTAFWTIRPEALLARVTAMRDLCRQPKPGKNPAAELAAFFAAGATEGHSRLFLIGTKSLETLTYRIGQLVGASTSKRGQGHLPICGQLLRPLDIYQRDCIVVILTLRAEEDKELKDGGEQLERAGVPMVAVELESPEALGAELFKWELATALECAELNVNPFDEPDVQAGRERAAELIEGLAGKGELPLKTVRIREKGLELYAEGETRLQISTLHMADGLRTFFELRKRDGYLAILSYLNRDPLVAATLHHFREELTTKLGIPVLLSSGPQYLQSFEQVYKGGPSNGLFLIITGETSGDIAIPGAGYTFGQLQLALALADFESLESRQRRVIRLHITHSPEQGLADIEQSMQQALANMRPAAN
jgi:transaldolase / glucose-6-phosphate isomerase